MKNEKFRNPLLNILIATGAITSVFSIAKLLGFLSLSWFAVFSPIMLYIFILFLIAVIYATVLAAFSKIKEDVKEIIEEVVSKNTEDTMVMMATVISEEETKAKIT